MLQGEKQDEINLSKSESNLNVEILEDQSIIKFAGNSVEIPTPDSTVNENEVLFLNGLTEEQLFSITIQAGDEDVEEASLLEATISIENEELNVVEQEDPVIVVTVEEQVQGDQSKETQGDDQAPQGGDNEGLQELATEKSVTSAAAENTQQITSTPEEDCKATNIVEDALGPMSSEEFSRKSLKEQRKYLLNWLSIPNDVQMDVLEDDGILTLESIKSLTVDQISPQLVQNVEDLAMLLIPLCAFPAYQKISLMIKELTDSIGDGKLLDLSSLQLPLNIKSRGRPQDSNKLNAIGIPKKSLRNEKPQSFEKKSIFEKKKLLFGWLKLPEELQSMLFDHRGQIGLEDVEKL